MTACTEVQIDIRAAEVTREELVDLLCADEEWLRAEFDSLVAASWGAGRPTRPGRGASPGPPRGSRLGQRPHLVLTRAPSSTAPVPVADWTGRSRSPPVRG
jgi:hypothetical protein